MFAVAVVVAAVQAGKRCGWMKQWSMMEAEAALERHELVD
jgi:hypothetical protein